MQQNRSSKIISKCSYIAANEVEINPSKLLQRWRTDNNDLVEIVCMADYEEKKAKLLLLLWKKVEVDK